MHAVVTGIDPTATRGHIRGKSDRERRRQNQHRGLQPRRQRLFQRQAREDHHEQGKREEESHCDRENWC